MTGIKTVHECLFCPQTFDTAAAKDDHILEHFAQETCTDCNQNLIRIGNSLYTLHNAVTCVKTAIKTDSHCHSRTVDHHPYPEYCHSNESDYPESTSIHAAEIQIKTESTTTNEFADDTYVRNSVHDEQLIHTMETNQLENQSNERDALKESQILLDAFDMDDTNSKTSNSNSNLSTETYSSIYKGIHFCAICSKSFLTCEERNVHETNCFARNVEDNMFRCTVCDYRCKFKANLQKHILRRHSSSAKKLTCKQCFNLFLQKSALQRHQTKCTYSYRDKIKCKLCDVVLASKCSYKKHMIGMHGYLHKNVVHDEPLSHNIETNQIENEPNEKDAVEETQIPMETFNNCNLGSETYSSINKEIHFCDTCSMSFSTFEECTVHESNCCVRTVQDNTNRPFSCPICDYSCRLKGNLQKHILRRHDPSVRQLTCKQCSNVFLDQSALQRHQTKCTYNYRGKIKCKLCAVELDSKYSYRKHMIGMHFVRDEPLNHTIETTQTQNESNAKDALEETQIPFETLNMDDTDSNTSHYNLGSEISSSINKEIHFCDTCSMSFSTFEERNVHKSNCCARIVQDNMNRPFSCPICDYSCRYKGNLQKHILRRHDPSVKQLTCKQCGNVFLDKSALQRHQTKCTYNYRDKNKGEQTKCDVCGAVLGSKSSYKKHMIRMHSAIETIYCTVCKKLFSNTEDRDAHEIECISKRALYEMKRQYIKKIKK